MTRQYFTLAGLLLLAALSPLDAQDAAPTPPMLPQTDRTDPTDRPDAGRAVTILSIDAAVQAALRQNPTLESAAAAVRRAEGIVAEARSLRLPRVDGNARATVQGPIPTFTFVQQPTTPGGTPRSQDISLGRTFSKNFQVGATYDVDPFGRLRDEREIAKYGVGAARSTLFAAQNELVYAVQNVFLAGLRSQELIGVAQEAVDLAAEQHRVADAQFRAGIAPEFDVIRARVQVANNRQNLVATQASFKRTLNTLGQLISLPGERSVQLVTVTPPAETDETAIATARAILEPAPGATGPTPLPQAIETALSEAFTRRPDVVRAEWNRRIAERRLTQARKGLLPEVTLGAAYQYNPDVAGFAAEKTNWSLIANVSIPIWDAGLTRARKHQARAGIDAANADARGAKDNVTAEVKTALTDLEEARERRTAAAANTAQAREALRIAGVRYTAGLAQNVEVTDAQVALTQARSNEVNAAFDYLAALANLNRSLGRYAGEALSPMKP